MCHIGMDTSRQHTLDLPGYKQAALARFTWIQAGIMAHSHGYKQAEWVRFAWIHVGSMDQISLDTGKQNGPD